MYLFVIIGLYSRYIVDYELSMTLDRQMVLGCLKRAFEQAKPEIINRDQVSQFTSPRYIEILKNAGIQISMDDKGRATDSIFVERLWRGLKYEEVYLHDCASPARPSKKSPTTWTFITIVALINHFATKHL